MRHHSVRFGVAALAAAWVLVACSHEAADWKAATTADSSEAYQQFLTQHPNSANAAQARARMAQLQEEHDWQGATAADTRDAYEQFLAQHPDGRYAQEARIRIENFAQSAGAPAAAAAAAVAGAAAAKTPHAAARTASAGSHYVQLGAYRTQASAESQWKRLSARYAKELGALSPHYVAGRSKTGKLVRLQVAVASSAAGKALCARLKSHSQSCVAVVPVHAG